MNLPPWILSKFSPLPQPGSDPADDNFPSPDTLSELDVLSQILDELRMQRGNDYPADAMQRYTFVTGVAAGTRTIYFERPVEYVIITDNPVANTRIRVGDEGGYILTNDLAADALMNIQWPRMEAITIEWTGAAVTDRFEIFASNRPIKVEVYTV